MPQSFSLYAMWQSFIDLKVSFRYIESCLSSTMIKVFFTDNIVYTSVKLLAVPIIESFPRAAPPFWFQYDPSKRQCFINCGRFLNSFFAGVGTNLLPMLSKVYCWQYLQFCYFIKLLTTVIVDAISLKRDINVPCS